MKEENENNKTRIILARIVTPLIFSIFIYFYIIRDLISGTNGILVSIGIGLAIGTIHYILEKMGIIKQKTKEEREKEKEEKLIEKERVKLEKEEIDKRDFKNLISAIEKEESKLEYMKDSLSKRKEYGDDKWVLNFVYFGLVVFFIGLLFFGTLDGKYLGN